MKKSLVAMSALGLVLAACDDAPTNAAPDGGGGTTLTASECVSTWSAAELWDVYLVIPGVTDADGDRITLRIDPAASGTNTKTCSTFASYSGAELSSYTVDCSAADQDVGTSDLTASGYGVVLSTTPLVLHGDPSGNCYYVTGEASFDGHPGTFSARIIE